MNLNSLVTLDPQGFLGSTWCVRVQPNNQLGKWCAVSKLSMSNWELLKWSLLSSNGFFPWLVLIWIWYTNIHILLIWVTDKIWYMAKGHPWVGWAPIGFAVAAPCTNLPEGIVLGWAPIGFAAMATPRPSQYYFGHLPNFVRYSYVL